jgi:hypothetical protein
VEVPVSEWSGAGTNRCRWPDKIRHPTRDAAQQAIRSLDAAGKGVPDMTVYPCGNHWHIGHDLNKFKARIRKSLAGAPKPRRRR